MGKFPLLVLEFIDGKLAEVVVTAVIDIEVDIALDAWKAAGVGVLPELPRPRVLYLVDIVMGYPIGIAVEATVAEVLEFEFVVGVDDGLDMVAVFYNVKPGEDVALKILYRALLGLVLYIEHGGQVAFLQMYLLKEIIGLVAGRRFVAPEVVGTTDKSVFASLIEVVVKVFVHTAGPLCSLDHDEAEGLSLDGGILELSPVDITLIMADVDAVNHVSLGELLVAVEGAPAEAGRTNEEIVEGPDVEDDDQDTSYPPCP